MQKRLVRPGASGLYEPANEHDSCGIALVAKLWGEEPQQQVSDDLRHFKQIMEAGEVATVAGQPHG